MAAGILAAFLGALLFMAAGLRITLAGGIVLSIICAILPAAAFLRYDVWIEPVVPATASLLAVLISGVGALIIKQRRARLFRTAYGPVAPVRLLHDAIRKGRPAPENSVSAQAAFVAVRKTDLSLMENNLPPRESAAAIQAFREKAAFSARNAGAAITAVEGDLVIAVFGSPLEAEPRRSRKDQTGVQPPITRAVLWAQNLLQNKESDAWRCALDFGEAEFQWQPLGGYWAFGQPAVRARVLTGLTGRCKCAFLASEAAVTAMSAAGIHGIKTTKAGVLNGEPFYEIAQ
jgi:hypothetical protein